jgi:hypothetical protein
LPRGQRFVGSHHASRPLVWPSSAVFGPAEGHVQGQALTRAQNRARWLQLSEDGAPLPVHLEGAQHKMAPPCAVVGGTVVQARPQRGRGIGGPKPEPRRDGASTPDRRARPREDSYPGDTSRRDRPRAQQRAAARAWKVLEEKSRALLVERLGCEDRGPGRRGSGRSRATIAPRVDSNPLQRRADLLPRLLPRAGPFAALSPTSALTTEIRKAPGSDAFHCDSSWWPQRDSNPCLSHDHVFVGRCR